jgi:CheY-like chemotaxis protein
MNLVINASEALGGGNGHIRITTTPEMVTKERLREARLGQDLPAGDYVTIEVEDDGAGMSQDTMTRIFDPFFTTKFTGRGLGLAAVVGVVRTHRGALFLRSAFGHGTTFRILFPRARSGLVASQPIEPRAQKSEKVQGTILIVDDEPNVRRVACALLERNGYSVAVAADGYEALALTLAHGGQFNAVLLDLTMPGLDGPTTLKELRAINATIPVLLMSGFSETEARKRLPQDPLTMFLPKPFTAADLLKSLSELQQKAASKQRPDDTEPPS